MPTEIPVPWMVQEFMRLSIERQELEVQLMSCGFTRATYDKFSHRDQVKNFIKFIKGNETLLQACLNISNAGVPLTIDKDAIFVVIKEGQGLVIPIDWIYKESVMLTKWLTSLENPCPPLKN